MTFKKGPKSVNDGLTVTLVDCWVHVIVNRLTCITSLHIVVLHASLPSISLQIFAVMPACKQ